MGNDVFMCYSKVQTAALLFLYMAYFTVLPFKYLFFSKAVWTGGWDLVVFYFILCSLFALFHF